VREFEDRFIETQPHEEFRSDKLQLIEGNEQVFNEPLIIESENCNSDNEDDKENVNDRKRKQLFVKKRKIISPEPSHTTFVPNSLSNMSAQMLLVQEEELLLKRQELQVKRDILAAQKEILQELRSMNSNIQLLSDNMFSSVDDYPLENKQNIRIHNILFSLKFQWCFVFHI